MSGAFTAAGTKIYASAGLPATHDGAGFAALTWTEINDITSFPEFGMVYSPVNHQPLNSRFTQVLKGGASGGAPVIAWALSTFNATTDPGQALVTSYITSDDDMSFKVEANDNPGGTSNSIWYFRSKVFSNTKNVGNVAAVATGSVGLNVSGSIVEVAAVA